MLFIGILSLVELVQEAQKLYSICFHEILRQVASKYM